MNLDQEIASLRPQIQNLSNAKRMCAYSDEDNQCSGLIVISIPGWCDQSSERSDAGACILQKVITIVKLVVVEAVRKVEIPKGFPRALSARLFHSLSPVDRFLQKKSRQGRLGTTIADSVDPQPFLFCPPIPFYRFAVCA
jgi:hypothetical protein